MSNLALLSELEHIQWICNGEISIDENGFVNVNGSVNCSGLYHDEPIPTYYKIPFKFGKIIGDFDCSNNDMDSLENCPIEVTGNFVCYNNNFTKADILNVCKVGKRIIHDEEALNLY